MKTKQNEAATIIQSVVRGWLSRRRLANAYGVQYPSYSIGSSLAKCIVQQQREMKTKQNEAATIIQSVVRGWLSRKRLANAYGVQYPSYSIGSSFVRCIFQQQREMKMKQNEAATLIQSAVRGWLSRKLVAETFGVQHTWRFNELSLLQCIVQQQLVMKQNKAATIIQSAVRRHFAKHSAKQLQEAVQYNAAVRLQTVIRGFLARRKLSQLLLIRRQHVAAIVIQTAVRSYLKRQSIARYNQLATIIQSCYRGYLARKQFVYIKSQRERAAVVIQSYFRAFLLQKIVKCERETAIIIIQTHVRSYLARLAFKRQMHERQVRTQAVIILQTMVRSFLARRTLARLRIELERRNEAAVIIQAYCRGFLARKALKKRLSYIEKQNKAATIIEAHFRGFLIRKALKRQNNAAMTIQKFFRFVLAKRSLSRIRLEMEERNRVAVILQAHARGFLARQVYSKRIQQRVTSAVLIQSFVRGFLTRRRLLNQQREHSANIIQAYCRAYFARKAFADRIRQREEAAVLIQSLFRGFLVRRRQANDFQAACFIQAQFRGYLARKAYNIHIQQRNKAIVLIQACVRSYLTRMDLQRKRMAAVIIQSYIRMFLTRIRFKRLMCNIITVQSHIRAYLARQRVTDKRCALALNLVKRENAAVLIQCWWRAHRQRQNFLRLRAAVVLIQIRWRSVLLVLASTRVLKKQEQAVLLIQTAFRTRMAVRQFQKQRQCAKTIQWWWRAQKHRLDFIRNQTAAACIQRNWRKSSLRRYLYRRRSAAILIQSTWRGCILRKKMSQPTHLKDSMQTKSTMAAQLVESRHRLALANANARRNPQHKLGSRARIALANLLRYTSVVQILDALNNLDHATRLSKEVCFWLSNVTPRSSGFFPSSSSSVPRYLRESIMHNGPSSTVCLPHTLLKLLQSCNRSVPNEEIMLVATSCLINIARQPELAGRMDIWWLPPDTDKNYEINRQRNNSASSSSIRFSVEGLSPPSNRTKENIEFTEGLCLTELLFGLLQRLCRARLGTLSVRLFARIACLLAFLCEAVPPEVVPRSLLPYVTIIFVTIKRLWATSLSRLPVRSEVTKLLARQDKSTVCHSINRLQLLQRRIALELSLELLPAKPQVNPIAACDLLLLTLERQRDKAVVIDMSTI